MDKTTNVTGTGIAVALAVIIALALLFFGTRIFTFFNKSAVTSVATTTQQQVAQEGAMTDNSSTTQNNSNTMTDSNTSPLADIPADVTQLMTKDVVVGTGAEAKAGDTVTVQYVGMLTNGTVFDASANHGTTGFTFPLGAGQVIKGWDEGVVGMKVGGKRELVIPASLGYGAQSVGSIPANSTLVFEVELTNVQSAQ
jgi:FKBP-type peptidyl-prolyl cis-trans isomerase FkpA